MRNRIIIALLLTLLVTGASSQDLMQKATKTYSYRYEACTSLIIRGEKATIRITGKAQSQIELKISLVSKHKNQATALRDLQYIRFEAEKEGSQLNLRNFYESASRKIESNLSVVYELIVPQQLAMQVYNLYGSVGLFDLSGRKSADVSFGRLELRNISGNTSLQLKYSNLTAQNIEGKLSGTLSKSDAGISQCGAATELSMSYGNLEASLTPDCTAFRVDGTRAGVTLQTPSTTYNFDLKTDYSEVEVFGKQVKSPYRPAAKTAAKTIFVSTTYCPIKIKLQ